jgi:hypothetical protein
MQSNGEGALYVTLFKVGIERTKRRRIILASLTGFVPADLRDELPKDLIVSDNEIRAFLISMTQAESDQARRKYGQTFNERSNAALSRLAERELERNPKAPPNGRIASRFLDFTKKEVLPDSRPVNPDKE